MRDDLDFYETPEVATRALLQRETFEGPIWEPACGKGAISNILKEKIMVDICEMDICDYGFNRFPLNFLSARPEGWQFNNIITNPPFRLAKQFVEHALKCTTDKVAMFLRLAFLESQSRKEMFENTPLKTVYVFSKRLTIYPGDYTKDMKTGSGTMAFAWFVWDHKYVGEPVIRWI